MADIQTPTRAVVAVVLACALACVSACRDRDAGSTPAARAEPGAPDEPRELAVAALAYRAEGDDADPRITAAQREVRAHPDQSEHYLTLARAFLERMRERGDPKLMAYVKDAINAALQLAPENAQARHLEIVALFDGHRFDEAAARAHKLIEKSPNDTTAYILLSDALLELGQYEGAVDALQEAMDRFPDLRVHVRTGHLRWLHGDIEGAIESMGDALALGSVEPEATAFCLVELGVIHWRGGAFDRAEAAATRALELVPGYLPAITLRARIAAAQDRRDEAVALMDEVVARRPNVEELVQLAEWTAKADRDRSREYLARAEALARHDPLPMALHHARHHTENARALELVERALVKRPTVHAHAVHALALLRVGRLDEALAASERSLVLDTPDARLHMIRALVLAARGDRQAALEARDRAAALGAHVDPMLARELETRLSGTSEGSAR